MVQIPELSSTHSNCLLYELDFAEIALEQKVESFEQSVKFKSRQILVQSQE